MNRGVSGLLAALLLVSMSAFVAVPRSQAFVIWCWDDPTVSVNGTVFEIDIAVGGASQADVQANVDEALTTVYVPKGATTKKLSTTRVNFKEKVHFVEVAGKQDVTFVVTFKAKKAMPAAVALKKNGVLIPGPVEIDKVMAFTGNTVDGVTTPSQTLP